jgi:hypothetical protein
MLVENADEQTPADPSLLRIFARAHHIQARLIQNPKLTVHDIAREEHVSAAYLYSPLRFPWLAPDITTAIINGRKPPRLTAQTLMRLTPRLPAGWAEQAEAARFPLRTYRRFCEFPPPNTSASPDVGRWLRPQKESTTKWDRRDFHDGRSRNRA